MREATYWTIYIRKSGWKLQLGGRDIHKNDNSKLSSM